MGGTPGYVNFTGQIIPQPHATRSAYEQLQIPFEQVEQGLLF